MTEFLVKWASAGFLLGFAWSAWRSERRRAVGLGVAALALLAFEVGPEESLLELAAAALLLLEVRRLSPGAGRRAGWAAATITGGALVFCAVRPWIAAAARALS